MPSSNTHRDREILTKANGPVGKLAAFLRLSGPGWLQSAITLGGGSLGGALYLGVLGGSQMLWIQVLAILIGVVMLSSIAYVTLSTRVRPYQAINQYVNPVLGVGWITATILANMIWIMPQFSLCFDALSNNVLEGKVQDTTNMQILVSAIIAAVAMFAVVMSFRPGWMSKLFDLALKVIVGLIVCCFVWAIVYLTQQDELDWNTIWRGFIPDFTQWNKPAPEIASLLGQLPEQWNEFWQTRIVDKQQQIIIGSAATAVGINMTFLLPYSMIARGWDKPFRGLARFDLITAMAIPFMVVTSCIVLASANSFHAKADANFISDDVEMIQESGMFKGALDSLEERYVAEFGEDSMSQFAEPEKELVDQAKARKAARKKHLAEFASTLPLEERKLAATLVKPNTGQLAQSLEPVLGENARLIFGLGAFAMGFSTIMILMMINGYAVAELLGHYSYASYRTLGALLACAAGLCWIWIWPGESKTWLIIVASTFGAILLPIAYFAFFMLMNSRRLLGDEKPTGIKMTIWNILMLIGVAGALAQAIAATWIQTQKPNTGGIVIGAVIAFLALAIVGFSAKTAPSNE